MGILAFIIANWSIILIGLFVLGFVGVTIYNFIKLPIDKKYKTILTYLVYAVTVAEKHWGDKTGLIKLGEVYDAFTKKYPIIRLLISFETFKKLVDLALVEMRKILKAKEEAAKELAAKTEE